MTDRPTGDAKFDAAGGATESPSSERQPSASPGGKRRLLALLAPGADDDDIRACAEHVVQEIGAPSGGPVLLFGDREDEPRPGLGKVIHPCGGPETDPELEQREQEFWDEYLEAIGVPIGGDDDGEVGVVDDEAEALRWCEEEGLVEDDRGFWVRPEDA